MSERTVEQRELDGAVAAAVKRWRSVDMTYMPIYPGGQPQFDKDCQALAVAYMSDLAELRKDAERYRKLKASTQLTVMSMYEDGCLKTCIKNADLDAAVDAMT